MAIAKETTEYLISNVPLILYKTQEPTRAITIAAEVAHELDIKKCLRWNPSLGLLDASTPDMVDGSVIGIAALETFIRGQDERCIIIIPDVHRFFEGKDLVILQEVLGIIASSQAPVNLIGITSHPMVPREIDKQCYIVNIPLPDKKTIEALIDEQGKSFGVHFSSSMKKLLATGLNGLVEDEIHILLNRAIAASMNNRSHVGPEIIDIIVQQKKQVIEKSGLVEFIDEKVTIDEVGGLTRLKRWLKDRKQIFEDMDKAKLYGVKPPKGILLFGTPGSGKSLTAKVVATYYGLPLLRVDMGIIYGQNSPEEAIGKVTALADSIAPCILFIDELEKALAGSESGATDPTAIKMLGILLTWMQERTAPVFIIATANDISMIRVETYRDGRIDEKFFLGFLDNAEQVKQIIDIHIRIRLKGQEKTIVRELDYALIEKKMRQNVEYHGGNTNAGYAAANIEALVEKVLAERFFRGKQFIETKDFIAMLDIVRPQHGAHIATMLHRAKSMEAITA